MVGVLPISGRTARPARALRRELRREQSYYRAAAQVMRDLPNLSAAGLADPPRQMPSCYGPEFMRHRKALVGELPLAQSIVKLLTTGKVKSGFARDMARQAAQLLGRPVSAGLIIIAAKLYGGWLDTVYDAPADFDAAPDEVTIRIGHGDGWNVGRQRFDS